MNKRRLKYIYDEASKLLKEGKVNYRDDDNHYLNLRDALEEVCLNKEEAEKLAVKIVESRFNVEHFEDIITSLDCLDCMDEACDLYLAHNKDEKEIIRLCLSCILKHMELDMLAKEVNHQLKISGKLEKIKKEFDQRDQLS